MLSTTVVIPMISSITKIDQNIFCINVPFKFNKEYMYMISIDMIIPIPSNGTIKFTNDNSKNNTATNNIYARFAFFPVLLSFKIALIVCKTIAD